MMFYKMPGRQITLWFLLSFFLKLFEIVIPYQQLDAKHAYQDFRGDE